MLAREFQSTSSVRFCGRRMLGDGVAERRRLFLRFQRNVCVPVWKATDSDRADQASSQQARGCRLENPINNVRECSVFPCENLCSTLGGNGNNSGERCAIQLESLVEGHPTSSRMRNVELPFCEHQSVLWNSSTETVVVGVRIIPISNVQWITDKCRTANKTKN